MKVCVYAIAKNEEKFAERWLNSMREADEIYVLDTGSTDKTKEILSRGATVKTEIISPWRFDVARNLSLAMVPDDADLCVCTDLDEVFHPGWRKAMEAAFTETITRLKYRYTWNFEKNGAEGIVYWMDKAHRRHGYHWKNAVHEVLVSEKPEVFAFAVDVQLDHHADEGKDRTCYLPLLELAVREDPDNDRNTHYLAREYYYHGQWTEAIKIFERHLSLPSARWADERCASHRYEAKCYLKLDKLSEAYTQMLLAIAEAPHLREPWLDTAYFEYDRQNWLGCAYFLEYALSIKDRSYTYMTECRAWDATPYDVLSIAYYHLGDLPKAIENVRKAIKYSEDERLKKNLLLYENEAQKSI